MGRTAWTTKKNSGQAGPQNIFLLDVTVQEYGMSMQYFPFPRVTFHRVSSLESKYLSLELKNNTPHSQYLR